MRWDKERDWNDLLRPLSHLTVPGEALLVRWKSVTKQPIHFPPAESGLESARLMMFVCLHDLRRDQLVALEHMRSLQLRLLAATAGAKLDTKITEALDFLFWQWHHKVVPDAIKPSGEGADDLMKTFKENQAMFDSIEGFRVQAVDTPTRGKKKNLGYLG